MSSLRGAKRRSNPENVRLSLSRFNFFGKAPVQIAKNLQTQGFDIDTGL
jgi:hypothetical protein